MTQPLSLGVTLGYGDSKEWNEYKYYLNQITIFNCYLNKMNQILEPPKIYKTKYICTSEKIENRNKLFYDSEITKFKNSIYYTSLNEKEEIKKLHTLELEKIEEKDFDFFN